MNMPDWWHPLVLTDEHVVGHPGSYAHYIRDEDCEKFLWRALRGLPESERSWLYSSAVRVERSIVYLSGTEHNGYWGHEWTWVVAKTDEVFAWLKLTSFFRNNRSDLQLNDGTSNVIDINDVNAVTGMWKKTIRRYCTQ
jgi:hypothetical protein